MEEYDGCIVRRQREKSVYSRDVGSCRRSDGTRGMLVIEISPGGFLAFSSPKPVAGITSLDVTATAAAVVKIWLLG